MTFSYVLPIASDLHRVRLYLHDTEEAAAEFQDEELDAILDEAGSPLGAAIIAAEALARRYGRLGSISVGDVRIDGAAVSESWASLAEELRDRQARAGVTPFAGGVDAADVAARRSDETTTHPSFTRTTGTTERAETWPC